MKIVKQRLTGEMTIILKQDSCAVQLKARKPKYFDLPRTAAVY